MRERKFLTVILGVMIAVNIGFTRKKGEKHRSAFSSSYSSATEGCSIKDSLPPQFGYAFTGKQSAAKTSDILFSIRGKNTKKTSSLILNNAKELADIIPSYPTQWITDYKNTEIIVSKNGEESKALGSSSTLSEAQLALLKNTGEIEDILILVNYESKNVVTKKMEPHQMKVSMDVTPQTNAHFPGGDSTLRAYLYENSLPELREYIVERMQKLQNQKQPVYEVALIQFTVNSSGQSDHFELGVSCGNHEMDSHMIGLLKNMPKWTPAVNEKGNAVSQKFVFVAGQSGC